MSTIATRGLARTFRSKSGDVEAVRGIDIDVAPGEILGLLGPNGAGKTTALRMLVTLLEPTGGEATVAGHDLRNDPGGVRRSIGYVQQGHGTERAARVREELVDQAALYGMEHGRAQARVDELIAAFELDAFANKLVKELSGGQRRRLEVAIGMVHEPKLVFLDEPTTGLDPQSRANLWEHVRTLRDRHGATVVITTHYLEEADALCDRILILDEGTHHRRGHARRAQAPPGRRPDHDRGGRRPRAGARRRRGRPARRPHRGDGRAHAAHRRGARRPGAARPAARPRRGRCRGGLGAARRARAWTTSSCP